MSNLSYYNAQEKYWVSPRLVLVYYDDLLKQYREDLLKPKFKKVREARSVALQLLGHYADNGKHYYMQVPKDTNESPDIVSMYLDEPTGNEKGIQLRLQDVEVVDFEEHASENLSTFLIQKKLNPYFSKQAYDDKTTILCHIKKPQTYVNHKDLHNSIKTINPRPQVLIMGEIASENYRLTLIWPYIGSVTYNPKIEATNYPKPDSLKLSLGINNKVVFGDAKLPLPTINEVFELQL